jgi:peptide/nickel transport system permease protein
MSITVAAPVSGRRYRARAPLSAATAIGLLFTAVTVLGAVCAPLLTSADPMALSQDVLQPPGWAHLMGTDDLGRDLFARVLYGGRVSLAVGVFSAVISLVFGVSVGVAAGFFGGALDEVMMRITEIFQILPKLLVAVVVVSLVGSSLANEIAVIGLLSWPATARVIRTRVQLLRGQDFIAAARMSGASRLRILWHSILPNVAPFVLVSATLQVASAIVSEAFLSFLGLGDPGAPSWGLLLQQGQLFLQQAWWLTTLPGLALAMTVLGMNLLGDGLGGKRRRR